MVKHAETKNSAKYDGILNSKLNANIESFESPLKTIAWLLLQRPVKLLQMLPMKTQI